jgi:hypothetical protein
VSISVLPKPSRVSWSLFRPVTVIPGTKEEAQIHPEMQPFSGLRPLRSPGDTYRFPSFTITVGVNRDDTLVVNTASKTSELLQHEQGHFDILLLTVRALARELEALEAPSINELQSGSAREIHQERATTIDAAYDEQTDHSRNKPVQNKWNKAIADALADARATKLVGFEL